jgi:N-acetyl-gamma-glutamyl-phosphate reductase
MYDYFNKNNYHSPSEAAGSANASQKIKAGIIGGAGYTGGELLRLLINHPFVDIAYANSKSNAGNLVSAVHTDLIGEIDLKFTDNDALSEAEEDKAEVLFLCLGHGDAKKFWKKLSIHRKMCTARVQLK